MPHNPRSPTRADRHIVSNYLRAEAAMMRSAAEGWRDTPDEDGVLDRFAAQQETRAGRLERVAEWMTNV